LKRYRRHERGDDDHHHAGRVESGFHDSERAPDAGEDEAHLAAGDHPEPDRDPIE